MRVGPVAVVACFSVAASADDAMERPGWRVIWTQEGSFAFPAEADEPPGGSVQYIAAPAPEAAPTPPRPEPSAPGVAAAPSPPPARAVAARPTSRVRARPECEPLRDRFAQRLYELRGVELDLDLAAWVRATGLYATAYGGPFLVNPFVTAAALGQLAGGDPLAFTALEWDLPLRSIAEELARCEADR